MTEEKAPLRDQNSFIDDILSLPGVSPQLKEDLNPRAMNGFRALFRAPFSSPDMRDLAINLMGQHTVRVHEDNDPLRQLRSLVMIGIAGQVNPEFAKAPGYVQFLESVAESHRDVTVKQAARIILVEWENPAPEAEDEPERNDLPRDPSNKPRPGG